MKNLKYIYIVISLLTLGGLNNAFPINLKPDLTGEIDNYFSIYPEDKEIHHSRVLAKNTPSSHECAFNVKNRASKNDLSKNRRQCNKENMLPAKGHRCVTWQKKCWLQYNVTFCQKICVNY